MKDNRPHIRKVGGHWVCRNVDACGVSCYSVTDAYLMWNKIRMQKEITKAIRLPSLIDELKIETNDGSAA
tara:strand:+ start:439 stop:648 length:210 start_codon:yes stop_codon:yes gene_type:complete